MVNYIYDLLQQCINISNRINLNSTSAGYHLKELDNQLSNLFELIKNEYPIYYEAYKHFYNNYRQNEYRSLIEIDCLLFLLEKEEKGKNRRKIFISHSSKDKNIIENFTKNILRLGMGISREDIFCTSIEGMNIRTGEDIRKHIKENLKYCDYIFLMISESLYEWRKLNAKDTYHRIAEGKYLKYLYSLHERNGTLDESDVTKLCPICNMQKNCEKENSAGKLSVYCIEGCFFTPNK